MSEPLRIEFAGLSLKNPFLLSSGPPTGRAEMLDRAFQAGWAGAVIKTIPAESLMQRGLEEEPRPLLAQCRSGVRRIGMGNISITGEWFLDDWAAALPALKRKHPDCVVLGSIGAEVIEEDWQRMAAGIEAAGFDGVELDLSCTHATLGREVPLIVGENPELTARVTGWVTDAVDIPVIPKLPASVRDWRSVLQACKDAGAAGVASINSLSALMGVNLETMEPQLSLHGYGTYCGYSGPGIKPIALRVVSQIAREGILPLSGIGGISSWQDAAEFLLLGARCVQVCTAVMWSGYGMVERMIVGLEEYLARNEIDALEELVGRANERVVDSVFKLQPEEDLVAFITSECTSCGRCVTSCWDGAHQAIVEREGAPPRVDPARCRGCALCLQVCPVDAIRMISRS